MELSDSLRKEIFNAQRNEITEYHVYKNIAKTLPDAENRRIVEEIAEDELRHSEQWAAYTEKKAKPKRWMIWLYTLISRVLGFTFGFKLMELGEEKAQINYEALAEDIPEALEIMQDENAHEDKLLAMLDEDRLRYAGSIVLGLSDALVELTGALAGLTLAFQDVNIIALSGLITGIAASLSMGASEYLSTSSEDTDKHPVRAALYTGIAYVLTVFLLILPYLLLDNEYLCLGISLATGVVIIAVFNFYISVARDESFKRRFFEMAGLSLGVAVFSFFIGYLIRMWLGVDI
jgi:VIT1/CCC1 family predicted Fe2+/Mn2+ transporter